MKRVSNWAMLWLTATLLVLALPSVAAAGQVFKFSTTFYGVGGSYATEARAYFSLTGLDSTKNTRIELRHGTDASYRTINQTAGSTAYYSGDITGMVPGDTIEVYQPQAASTPIEAYVTPVAELNFQVGSKSVSGTAPADQILEIDSDTGCSYFDTAQRVSRTGEAFQTELALSVIPGDGVRSALFSSTGDYTGRYQYAPGETPCIWASALPSSSLAPGAATLANPYTVSAQGFSSTVASDAKIEHVRAGSVLFSDEFTDYYWDADYDQPTLPGDQFNIFRPKNAASPSSTITVPQVSAVFDPTVDLVAVDGPALSFVSSWSCAQYICASENGRRTGARPAGRTILDFSAYQSWDSPVDLQSEDRVYVQVVNEARSLGYVFAATPGDLVAPTQKLTLASKLKLSKLLKAVKRGQKVKVRSSEAATATLTLKLGSTKLASGKRSVAAGTSSVTLKFTKAGKKTLGRLKSKGRRLKSSKATLTSVLVDASGNSSKLTRTTKITR